MACLVKNGFFFPLVFVVQGKSREVHPFMLLLSALILDGHRRKAEVGLSTKRGRPVLKAIVAGPVHSADGLIAAIVRVLHLHFATENHNNLPGCKPGLDVKDSSWQNVVCWSLPLNHHQVRF